MSARWSTLVPVACSGAMYWGVPVIIPVAVRPLGLSSILTTPKSAR